jgi:hypothetical protein
LIESRVILFETVGENPYLSAAYVRGRFSLTWSLVFLGEWGEALREIEDAIAMFDKNANSGYLAMTSLLGSGRRCHFARDAVALASSLDFLQGTFEKIHLQGLLCQKLLQAMDFFAVS